MLVKNIRRDYHLWVTEQHNYAEGYRTLITNMHFLKFSVRVLPNVLVYLDKARMISNYLLHAPNFKLFIEFTSHNYGDM